MKVAVFGLGLIGGSVGIDLKRRGFASEIIGVGRTLLNIQKALDLGLADRMISKEQAVKEADLIVLSVPVNILVEELKYVLDNMRPDAVVTDMGSTKSKIIEAVRTHPLRGRYVASHPMAGTEYSGPTAAFSGLFDGKLAIICDKEDSDADALALIEKMYLVLGMHLQYMKSKAHDLHAAYVSHVSHITSFVLGATVLEKEKSEKAILSMAGGGFESTVRLAKSSPEMWSQIFEQNGENIVEVLNTYIDKITAFRDKIKTGDTEYLKNFMAQANNIKRILKKEIEK
ncbi:MAG: prephenate dehydrogenase [Chitinophagales bacterium]|nr:prephenate dehydrogenase [Chitinophagales bacterium]